MTHLQFGAETEGMKNLNQATADQRNGTMPMSMAVVPQLSTGSNPAVSFDMALDGETACPTEPKKDRSYYQAQIKLRWNGAYKAILSVCHLIVDARINLSPEDWVAFVKDDCPFDYSVLQKFMNMASHPALNNPDNEQYLPHSWTALYEICQMKEQTFRHGIQQGIIHPNCTLADLKKLRKLDPPKRKPAKKAAQTGSSDANRKSEPKPSSSPAKAASSKSESATAVVKAPVNTLGLHVVESTPKTDSATPNATAPEIETAPSTASGRILIVLTKALVDRDESAVKQLKSDIEALMSKYAFIGGVELEVAA